MSQFRENLWTDGKTEGRMERETEGRMEGRKEPIL